jgi:hypothetical protein
MSVNGGFGGTKVNTDKGFLCGFLETTNPIDRNVRRAPTRRASGLKANADEERVKQLDLQPTSTTNQASYVRRCCDG